MSDLPVLRCAPPAAANAADALLAAAAAVKGWGLVDFIDEAGAANAISEFNDQELMGQKIFLREDRDTGAGAARDRARSAEDDFDGNGLPMKSQSREAVLAAALVAHVRRQGGEVRLNTLPHFYNLLEPDDRERIKTCQRFGGANQGIQSFVKQHVAAELEVQGSRHDMCLALTVNLLDDISDSSGRTFALARRAATRGRMVEEQKKLDREKADLEKQAKKAADAQTGILMNALLMNALEQLQDANAAVRKRAVRTLRRKLGPAELAQHAEVVVARLEDTEAGVRAEALTTLCKLKHAALARHADAVAARLLDSSTGVRSAALKTLRKLKTRTLSRHADVVVAMLSVSDSEVRSEALATMGKLRWETLAQHAGSVAARLEDSSGDVRRDASQTLRKLDPAAVAQYADALIARLEDSEVDVRTEALETLGKLEPATLAQHAGAVAARLEDSHDWVRYTALKALGQLEPVTLAHHAYSVVASLEDAYYPFQRDTVLKTLRQLPRFITRGVDFYPLDDRVTRKIRKPLACALRSRLLGRLAWYKFRLRLFVKRVALYWFALPYRLSGPGHAREVAAWDQMNS